MRRTWLLAVLAAAAVLALAGGGGAATGAYADPAGDSGAAPDITSTNVSDDASGRVLFEIAVPNRPDIRGTRGALFVLIDSDRNAATGDEGVEYAVFIDGATGSAGFLRWNGSDYEPAEAAGFLVGYANGKAQVAFNRSAIGGVATFNFWILATEGDEEGAPYDVAPDGDAIYTFPRAATITGVTAPAAALLPKSGTTYSVRGIRLLLSNGLLVAPAKLTCTLKHRGAALKPLAGGCRWALSKTLKGKTLQLTFRATYGGQTVSRTLSVRVA